MLKGGFSSFLINTLTKKIIKISIIFFKGCVSLEYQYNNQNNQDFLNNVFLNFLKVVFPRNININQNNQDFLLFFYSCMLYFFLVYNFL